MFVSQKAELLFCLLTYFRFFDFSSPLMKSLLKVGTCTVQHLTGGVPICLFYSGHDRWFEGRSGRFETSSAAAVNERGCQSLLFEVLTAMSANNPGTLGWGLFDVENLWKKKCQKRCTVQYFSYLSSHLGRLRWTLITLLAYSLCQSWLRWRNNSMNNNLLFWIF